MNRWVRALATVVGLFGVLVLTLLAFGVELGPALGLIWRGAFGTEAGVARTLARSGPLLLTGLGVLIAWRAGMFNIGGEGQYVVGGLCGAAVFAAFGAEFGAPPVVVTILIVLASVAGGALFAALAAVLQIKRGVPVVISTILLNFVALQGMRFLINGPLKGDLGLPQTLPLPQSVMFAKPNVQTDFHTGLVLALVAAVAVAVMMGVTRFGFRIRVVGENPGLARTMKIPAAGVQMRAMLWSGGLCGLAAAVQYLGLAGSVSDGFAENWGFLAIPVALLGALDPVGTVIAALYFGALIAGCEALSRETGLGTSVVFVIQGAAVLAVVTFSKLSEERQKRMGGARDE